MWNTERDLKKSLKKKEKKRKKGGGGWGKGNGFKKVTIVILWKRAAWNTGRDKCDALEEVSGEREGVGCGGGGGGRGGE